MSSNRNSSSSGIGICGVLTIVFVVLKLVGVINWSSVIGRVTCIFIYCTRIYN